MHQDAMWWDAEGEPGAAGLPEPPRGAVPTCPHGHANPADAVYCGDCGTPLAVAGPPEPPADQASLVHPGAASADVGTAPADVRAAVPPRPGAVEPIGPLPGPLPPAGGAVSADVLGTAEAVGAVEPIGPVPGASALAAGAAPAAWSAVPVPPPVGAGYDQTGVPAPALADPVGASWHAPAASVAAAGVPPSCPSGHATVPGAAFCGVCGTALAVGGPSGSGPAHPVPPSTPVPQWGGLAQPVPPGTPVPPSAPQWGGPAPGGSRAIGAAAPDSRPPAWRLALAAAGAFLLISPFLMWTNLPLISPQGSSLFDLWSQPSNMWADTSIKGDFTGVLVALVLGGVVLIVLAALRMRWRTAAWAALGTAVVSGAVAVPLAITVFKTLQVRPTGTGLDLAGIGLLAAIVVALVGVVRVALQHARRTRTAAGLTPGLAPTAGGAADGPAQW